MEEKYLDKNLSLEERKQIYKKDVTDKMMNPIPSEEFNPLDFDPISTGSEEDMLAKRNRVHPPKKMETNGLEPKSLRVGQMVGMYESKQDLYLLFAHRCNDLQDEVDYLKKQIELLISNINNK